MGKKYEKLTKEQKALNGLANFIIMHGNNDDCIEWHDTIRQAINELDELKRDVARYFGLEKRLKYINENANTPYGIMDMRQSYLETLKELNVLEDRLSKVEVRKNENAPLIIKENKRITLEKAIQIMSSGFGWSSEEHRQVIELLKQQEKKDKLLELYRKAHLDVLNGELAEQIQALEEELK